MVTDSTTLGARIQTIVDIRDNAVVTLYVASAIDKGLVTRPAI